MRQDVDAVMTKTEARERGYLPTAEVPALLGVKRDVLQLCQTMRREGLRPIRVGHAYWWSVAAVEAWAAQRRWVRSPGTPANLCSAPGSTDASQRMKKDGSSATSAAKPA